jgi:glutaredoxin 3
MNNIPNLYVKDGCPWCMEALTFFNNQGLEIHVCDVIDNPVQMERMVELSGQTLTPTFEYGEFVVSDFSVDEFMAELEENPEVKSELGIIGGSL